MTDEEVFGTAPPVSGLRSVAESLGWPKQLPEGAPIPTLEERLATDRDQNPNSPGNLADRAFTSVVTAVPDTAIGVHNIAARSAGYPGSQIEYLAPQMRAAAGGKEMPADAPLWQRGLEGVAAGLLGNPRSLIPSTLGWAGGEGGAKIGEALGIDPQFMALLGGVLGGTARTTAPNTARAGVAGLYRNSGRENAGEIYDAAARTGTTPTGAMLGNQGVQRLEQVLERRPGSGPTIVAAREQARNQFTDAAEAVPPAAGATMRDPTEIGRFTQATAGNSLDMLEAANRLRQEQMRNQVGNDTPINVAQLDRTMSGISDLSRTRLAPEQADVVGSRLAELRRMYMPVPEGQQGPPAPQARTAPFVNWRNTMLNRREGEPPMSNEATVPITQDARQAYRDTAIQQGVPPAQFDVTQMRSRNLPGQSETLTPLTARPEGGTTDLATTYSRLPSLTDPQGMQELRGAVNAAQGVTAGEPAVNNILASRINDLLDQTLLKRGESALGPINFADAIQKKADPQALQQSVGPQGAQTLQDVATLARSFHRPTVSGGGTRSIMDVLSNTGRAAAPLAAGALSMILGHEPGSALGIGAGAGVASEALNRYGPISRLRGAMLNSPTAAASMAGRPIPYGNLDINDLRAAMNALQGSTPFRSFRPPGQ